MNTSSHPLRGASWLQSDRIEQATHGVAEWQHK
jgi:hypothetical protein